MTQFSVRHFARFVTRHPNWCLLIAFLLTAAALVAIRTRLVIEMDVAALLPEESEVAQITQAALRDFGSFDFMLVVVEATEPGQEHLLKRAADLLDYGLEDKRFIREATHRIQPDSLEIGTPEGDALAVALLTEADWDALQARLRDRATLEGAMSDLRAKLNAAFLSERQREQLLQDPLGVFRMLAERVKIKSGPLKQNMDLRDPYFISRDGMMLLVLVWPVRPATDLQFAQEFHTFLEETRVGVYLRHPEFGDPHDRSRQLVRISYFGSHWEAISDSQVVKNDFYRTSIASFVAVICLFFFAFRRPEALLFVAIPLVVGVIWTLGITSLLIGRLTQVTMVFSAILIGLGIDFSVHLYNRYLEEIRRGAKNHDAIRVAVIETGPGIIAGALTTAIAFFGMMITSFVGFRELGLVAGFGVLCCLMAVLLLLPAMLGYFGRGPVGEFTRRPMSNLGLRRFHYTVVAYPRVTLIVGLIVCFYLGVNALNVRFQDDFRSLKQPSDEYRELHERIASHFMVPPNQIVLIVRGGNVEQALQHNDQLYRNIYIAERAGFEMLAVDSMRHYIPSQETQRQRLAMMRNENLDSVRARLEEIGREFGFNPRVFDRFMERLQQFQAAAGTALEKPRMPVDLGSEDAARGRLLNQIARSYVYRAPEEVRIVTRLYPPSESEYRWESQIPDVFKENLATSLPEPPLVTGSVTIQEELRRIIVRDLAKTVLVVLACVLAYLIIYFESLKRAALALIPVVLALMCMLGVIHLTGMELHYLNIISLPMIVGIGVDSGIHLLQRFFEHEKRDLYSTVTRTGRAVIITGMTTIFGFGSLALANFRGIRELGLFAIIGVSFTLLTALLILPATLELMDPRKRYRGGEGDDLG